MKSATEEKKPLPPTLQVVMSEREQELLMRLCDQLGVSKSAVLIECAKLAIESVKIYKRDNNNGN